VYFRQAVLDSLLHTTTCILLDCASRSRMIGFIYCGFAVVTSDTIQCICCAARSVAILVQDLPIPIEGVRVTLDTRDLVGWRFFSVREWDGS
jgi:hypothetical protein